MYNFTHSIHKTINTRKTYTHTHKHTHDDDNIRKIFPTQVSSKFYIYWEISAQAIFV